MQAWFSAAAIVGFITAGAGVLASAPQPLGPSDSASVGMHQEPRASQPDAAADSDFLTTAAMAGLAEVEHGKEAAQHGTSSEVKEFGKRMVADHTKSNAELKSLASTKNVSLPTELDATHQAMQDKLAGLKGTAFDSAYSAHMVTAHKEAVALFEREARMGNDADVKAFAEKSLPTLREHLKMAEALSADTRP